MAGRRMCTLSVEVEGFWPLLQGPLFGSRRGSTTASVVGFSHVSIARCAECGSPSSARPGRSGDPLVRGARARHMRSSACEVAPPGQGTRGAMGRGGCDRRGRDSGRTRRVDLIHHLVHSLGSADFEARDRAAAAGVAAPRRDRRRQIVIWVVSATARRPLGAPAEPRRDSEDPGGRARSAHHAPAAMIVGPGSAAFVTILALVDQTAGNGVPTLGLRRDAAGRARRRPHGAGRCLRRAARRTASPSTSAALR